MRIILQLFRSNLEHVGARAGRNLAIWTIFCPRSAFYTNISLNNVVTQSLKEHFAPILAKLFPAPTGSKVVRDRYKMILKTLCYHLI